MVNDGVNDRMAKELKDRLESYTTSKGMSFVDFIKEALGAKEREGSYEGGFRDGYHKGYYEGQQVIDLVEVEVQDL